MPTREGRDEYDARGDENADARDGKTQDPGEVEREANGPRERSAATAFPDGCQRVDE